VTAAAGYIPERGDLMWVDLSPTRGHEQSGRRPVLVLSPRAYNRKTGLCVVCVATRQRKGYAFEVAVDETPGQESIVLADHVRNIDWRTRRAERFRRVSAPVVDEVTARLSALIVPDDAAG
jgi:mRNA interferase MazF